MPEENERPSMVLEPYEKPKRWFQNPLWIGAVAAVIFALGTSSWALYSYATHQEVLDAERAFDNLEQIAGNNAEAIARLDENQVGIDKLVAFVDQLQAESDDGTESRTDQLLRDFITILCSSDDPIQIATCVELGYIPGG